MRICTVALEQEAKMDAPVPGMSLTAEPRSRPWRKPYRYATVDEVAIYYLERVMTAEFKAGLIEQVETGLPLSTITDLFITTSTMNGVHSIDLGALASPIIIAAMKGMLDEESVSYKVGDEPEDQPKMTDKQLRALRDKLSKGGDLEQSVPTPQIEMSLEEPMEEEPVEEPEPMRGLMSRTV